MVDEPRKGARRRRAAALLLAALLGAAATLGVLPAPLVAPLSELGEAVLGQM